MRRYVSGWEGAGQKGLGSSIGRKEGLEVEVIFFFNLWVVFVSWCFCENFFCSVLCFEDPKPVEVLPPFLYSSIACFDVEWAI